METLWIFPLYFLCPLTGIIFIIIWLINRRKENFSKRLLYWGLTLLMLPFLHQLLMFNQQRGIEDDLIGTYICKDSSAKTLKINPDKSFEIVQKNPPTYQKGQWSVVLIDDYEIDLIFPNHKNDVSFHIAYDADYIVLQEGFMPSVDKFVKQKLHSH